MLSTRSTDAFVLATVERSNPGWFLDSIVIVSAEKERTRTWF
jgi:hypothetical protein